MHEYPDISIIVPAWNREDLIERCLDSVLTQTMKPYELIVVDNASTDKTYETVENWMKRHGDSGMVFKLLKECRKGAWAARQTGLENASGEYMIFFDSDDIMKPSLIEKAISEIQNHSCIDIVCWKACIHQLDGNKKIPPFIFLKPLEGHLIHTLLRPQGYIVKKDFIEKAKGWSKPLEVWNDLELGLRLLINNPSIAGIDEILADIYAQEESITGRDFSSKEGAWEKTLDEMEIVANTSNYPQKNKIKKILNYRRAILAAHYYRENNIKGAEKLISKTVRDTSFFERLLLKFSYHFTRFGLRGAWRIVGNFY